MFVLCEVLGCLSDKSPKTVRFRVVQCNAFVKVTDMAVVCAGNKLGVNKL